MRVPTPDPGYWPNKVVGNEWKQAGAELCQAQDSKPIKVAL